MAKVFYTPMTRLLCVKTGRNVLRFVSSVRVQNIDRYIGFHSAQYFTPGWSWPGDFPRA